VHATLIELGMDPNVSDVSPEDLTVLRDALSVCETSKKLYMIAIGRLQECLGKPNSLKRADLLWNKCDHRRVFISMEDFKAMLVDCTPRERIVMMLGAYMGLRRSEICGIRLEDIKQDHIIVHGKGHGSDGKTVHVTIPAPVRREIDTWMRYKEDSDWLVPNSKGQKMTSDQIGRMIHDISERNGVQMTPHSLRRLYATTLYDAGVDLNTIRVLMRHNSINTTLSCYIDVNPQRREDALDKLCRAFEKKNDN